MTSAPPWAMKPKPARRKPPDAAGSSVFARLDLALERIWTADISAIAVIRAALGHFQRLALVRENVARGENLDSALKQLPHRYISCLAAQIAEAQARVWSGEKAQ